MYDWANSAFATTVMAGFFPIFFEKYWSNPNHVDESTFYLGLSNSVAALIVAIMAPFLGAISDIGSLKKKFLFTFAFLGILSTLMLWFVAQGDWQLAAILYALGCIGFSSGNVFYDSMLPFVAKREELDFVSSLGFSMGYLGGGLLFVLNILMYQNPSWFGIPDSSVAIRLSFVTVGIWWGVFSIPIFLFVPERDVTEKKTINESAKLGWIQLKETFQEIRKMKIIGTFLFAYWLYMDGVDTIIRMAVKVGSSLGFEASDMLLALVIVQFIAFPGGLIFNWFAKKVEPKNAVIVAIVFYTFGTGMSYFMTTTTHFFMLAVMIGLFLGGIQAISRSLFARLVPKGKEGEYFGFYNMLGKFSAVLGPLMLGVVTLITGSVRAGLLSIIILFIGGGLMLYKVDFNKGEQIAKEFGA